MMIKCRFFFKFRWDGFLLTFEQVLLLEYHGLYTTSGRRLKCALDNINNFAYVMGAWLCFSYCGQPYPYHIDSFRYFACNKDCRHDCKLNMFYLNRNGMHFVAKDNGDFR